MSAELGAVNEFTFQMVKDILLIVMPIVSSTVVAIISYRSNKKSNKEFNRDFDAKLKEKDADIANEIAKLNIEFNNKLYLHSFENSVATSDKYLSQIEITRHGNISNLSNATTKISSYISNNTLTIQELSSIKNLLEKIRLPFKEEELYPYEVPILIDYNKLLINIDLKITEQGGGYNE